MGIPKECKIPEICFRKNVVYQCDITQTSGEYSGHISTYLGLTKNELKNRINKHLKTFVDRSKFDATTLSEHVHKLRGLGIEYTVEWSVVQQAPHWNGKFCALCHAEKSHILMSPAKNLLNQRSELFSKCRHETFSRDFSKGRPKTRSTTIHRLPVMSQPRPLQQRATRPLRVTATTPPTPTPPAPIPMETAADSDDEVFFDCSAVDFDENTTAPTQTPTRSRIPTRSPTTAKENPPPKNRRPPLVPKRLYGSRNHMMQTRSESQKSCQSRQHVSPKS